MNRQFASIPYLILTKAMTFSEVSFSGRSGSVDAGFDTNVGLDGAGNLFGSKLDIMLDNLRIYNQSLSEADVLDIVCGDLPSAPICSGTGSGGNGTEFKPDGFGGKIDTLVFFMQENRAFDTQVFIVCCIKKKKKKGTAILISPFCISGISEQWLVSAILLTPTFPRIPAYYISQILHPPI